jgi:uncharacterized membrane protein YdjX (TVP38/TMEM64 family)
VSEDSRPAAGPGRREWRVPAVWRRHGHHLGPLLLALLVALLLASSATLQRWLATGIERPAELLGAHPVLGGGLFVLLAALSAMLSLFSSVPLVPFAVAAWGEATTAALLFAGWLLGGGASYLVGATLHHRIERTKLYARVAHYRERLRRHGAEFSVVLLFRLAMPAEIPGYVLGMLRYPFGRYTLATALAELPMALGTVYAGHLLIAERPLALAVLVAAAAAVLVAASLLFERRVRER